jgi:hypothetical protein
LRPEATQKEKAETLKNDTLLRRAQSEFDLENTGRHSKSATVIGSDGAPQYPRLPETNWTNDPTGVEPPLNIDVNAVEPVGEYGEVAASIERLERAAQEASPQSLDALPVRGAAGSLVSISEVEPPLTQSPTIRRKP